MLPYSYQAKNNSNIAKFADTAIYKLVEEMEKLGAHRASIVAKLAGGAQMFAFESSNELMRIGYRNAAAAREILEQLGIPVVAEDTGGNTGRTMILDLETGNVFIRMVGKEPKLL